MRLFHSRDLCQKKLVNFSRPWEECSQEEARIVAREENMGSEDKALTVHSKLTKRRSHHHRGKSYHKKDLSRVICYTCDEAGHYAKNCPKKPKLTKRRKKRRHDAHAVEDDEPSKKRTRYESEDSSSEDGYILISALTGNIIHGSTNWLIDSGASKLMT